MRELRLQPSHLLLTLTGLIYSLAVLALCCSFLPWPLVLLLLLYLTLALACCRQTMRLRESRLWLGQESCTLTDDKGSRRFYPPQTDYLGEYLIILRLAPYPEQTRSALESNGLTGQRSFQASEKLLIAFDSLSAADDWQLRRYLQRCRELHQSLPGG